MWRVCLLCALVLGLLATPPRPARAQDDGPAVLVRNLVTATASSEPADMTAVGGRLFFSADDGRHGRELWVSDGTAAGTRLLADLAPGAASSDPIVLTPFGGALFFTAGGAIWRTDAASAPVQIATFAADDMVAVGGRLFILATTDLWISDGTAAGTRRLTPESTGSAPAAANGRAVSPSGGRLVVVGPYVYAVTLSYQEGSFLLWRSDGTPGGTLIVQRFWWSNCLANEPGTPVPQIGCSANPSPTDLRAFDGALVYRLGRAIWRLDGDRFTMLFGDDCCLSARSGMAVAGDQLFFVAGQTNVQEELWVSDGTPAGTRRLAALAELEGPLVVLGNQVLFAGGNAGNLELWRSDGTPAGTAMLRDLLPGPSGSYPAALTALGDRLYFTASPAPGERTVWVSDGTSAGTRPFVTLGDGVSAETGQIVALGGRLYFAATDGSTNNELWVSNGAAAGTGRVADINATSFGSRPNNFVAVGERLFFMAYSDGNPWALMVSDGTTAGTQVVRDGDGKLIQPGAFTAVGERLFFFRNCDELWVVEGAASARRVATIAGAYGCGRSFEVVAVGQRLFFAAYMPGSGYTLWVSDGTAAGTRMVGLVDNSGTTGWYPYWLTSFKDRVYLVANDGVHGYELWTSDGTTAGTRMVKDIDVDPEELEGARPGWLTVVGDALFFAVENPTTQLWVTDGSTAGTRLVRDFEPAGGPDEIWIYAFQALGDRLVFASAGANSDSELWASDGSAAGTRMLKTFRKEERDPRDLTVAGAQVYFTANDPAHGRELWASDGTPAGTRQVFESAPGADARRIYGLMAFRDVLLFGTQGADGDGLWRSDGTAGGTWRLQGLRLPDVPLAAQAGARLFFRAITPETGEQLWTIALQPGVATRVGAPAQALAGAGNLVDVRLRFLSDGTATARGARLTLTLSDGVAYVSDTGGGPPQRSGSTVSWGMPAAGPLGGGAFSVRLRLPDAAPGASFPLRVTLSTPGETTPADNTTTVTLQVSQRVFLPVVRR